MTAPVCASMCVRVCVHRLKSKDCGNGCSLGPGKHEEKRRKSKSVKVVSNSWCQIQHHNVCGGVFDLSCHPPPGRYQCDMLHCGLADE